MSSGKCSIIKFAKIVRLDNKLFDVLLFLQFNLICKFGYGFLSGLHFGWIRFYVNACFQKVRLSCYKRLCQSTPITNITQIVTSRNVQLLL